MAPSTGKAVYHAVAGKNFAAVPQAGVTQHDNLLVVRQAAENLDTTVSGDAKILDVGGEMVLQTVSGDLSARAPSVERARINTTNGEARLETALEKGARVEMETINGDLTLSIRGDIDAEFDLETFNGSIRTDFGPDPVRTSQYAPGKELRFTEGEGSSRVIMETLNGGIMIRQD